jgi:hypothetical protein
MGLVFFILYVFLFSSNHEGLFMLCVVILFYCVSTTNLFLDERDKIDLLLSTLPVRRKTVVISKYLMVGVLFVAGYVLYTLPSLNFQRAMMGLLAVSLFNGIMLPLCFQFGAQATRYVTFVIFFAFFFLSSLIGNLDLSKYLEFLKNLNGQQTGLLLLGGAAAINLVSYAIACPIYCKKDF